MNIWLIILFTGLGTCLMRIVGVWVEPKYLQANWLTHIPLAVILVMALSSVLNLINVGAGQLEQLLAAIAAITIVILATLKELPLIICIASGCIVFGLLT